MAEELKEQYINVAFAEDGMNLNIHCTWENMAQVALTLLVRLYKENPLVVVTILAAFMGESGIAIPSMGNQESVMN